MGSSDLIGRAGLNWNLFCAILYPPTDFVKRLKSRLVFLLVQNRKHQTDV